MRAQNELFIGMLGVKMLLIGATTKRGRFAQLARLAAARPLLLLRKLQASGMPEFVNRCFYLIKQRFDKSNRYETKANSRRCPHEKPWKTGPESPIARCRSLVRPLQCECPISRRFFPQVDTWWIVPLPTNR